MGAARRALQLRVCRRGDRDQSPLLAPQLLLRTDVIPIPREYAWDRDDPVKSHPLSWSFDFETPPTGGGREGKRRGGGRLQLRGAWGQAGLRALPLPGPSAVGRGLEPSCPAWSVRWDVLIRPRAIFAARRVWNPGLGRLRGRLRETPGRKVPAPRAGTGPNPGPGPDQDPGPDRAPAPRSGSSRDGLRTGPARSGRSPNPPSSRRPAPPPPGALTHRRRRHQGSSGVLRTSGRGCRRRPGGRPRRVPARAPARPPVRPARQGMPWSEGRARRGRARPEGGGRTDSGLRNARGPPGPSHLLREGR